MTEYTVMHVLRLHRELPTNHERQQHRVRYTGPIVRPEQRRVGFLGYGMMAKAPAPIPKSQGFPVSAWTRRPKPCAQVPIFRGDDRLELFLKPSGVYRKRGEGLFRGATCRQLAVADTLCCFGPYSSTTPAISPAVRSERLS